MPLIQKKPKSKENSFDDFSEFDDLDDINDISDKKDYFDDTFDDFKTDFQGNAELTKILIETDTYLNRVQLTLENKYMKKVRYMKDGREEFTQIPTQIPNTMPMANSLGVSQIIGRMKALISHVISTSNINDQNYRFFIARFIRDFVRQLIVHRLEWEISENSLRDIRRIVVDAVTFYTTKPIQDKERKYNYGSPIREEAARNEKKNSFTDYWINKYKNKRGMA